MLLAVVLAGAACGPTDQSAPPVQTGEPPTSRIPVIVDIDYDQGDIAALAILLRDPGLDVRAITIAGTGLVRCQTGRLVTRYLLDELATREIPFGCGRETGGPDATPFPDDRRARADGAFGLSIPPQAEPGVPRDAVDVIVEAVDASPSAPTMVTLGPLTNLEDVLALDPTIADRIAGVHALIGTIDAPGNVFVDGIDDGDPLEWNAFADPSALAAVFASEAPISILPLDATVDVPIPADLLEELQRDHQAGAADLVFESLMRDPARLRPDPRQYLGDELAALTLTEPDLVTWEEATVVTAADGRLLRNDAGRSIRIAIEADRSAVEEALLVALRRGGPRTTPFRTVGSISVTFDGVTCHRRGRSDEPGPHDVAFTGVEGIAAGVSILGVRAPHRWEEVIGLLPTLDAGSAPPDWLLMGPVAEDVDGSGVEVTVAGDLAEGTYGPVCFTGTAPDVVFRAGTPFEVGAGTLPPSR